MSFSYLKFSFRASNSTSNGQRSVKPCPLCGEKNFNRLTQHLATEHNLDRQEVATLLAYTDQNNNKNARPPSMVSASSNSPSVTPSMHLDKSPQPTPISINTNNQQITCPSSPISESDAVQTKVGSDSVVHTNSASSPSPIDQQSSTGLPLDGKKRLLCPRCNTWVLNLTDHLIKKHHLISKQERLPFLRLARNRYVTPSSTPNTVTSGGDDQTPTNSFMISPDHSSPSSQLSNEQQQQQHSHNNLRQFQNLDKKNRKKFHGSTSSSNNLREKSNGFDQSPISMSTLDMSNGGLAATLSSLTNPNLLTMNSIQSFLNQQNSTKSDKFKFPMLTDNFAARSISAMKSAINLSNSKDQTQVWY